MTIPIPSPREGQETELCTGNTAYVLLKHVKHFTKQSFEVAQLRTDKTATMEQGTSETISQL